MKFDELKDKVREFPTQSGVYIMKNSLEKIIYIGKAKNLKNRTKSYFTGSNDLTPKTKVLVQNIFEIDYILTKTEVEAFLLEASLIKKHRPKYNIRLRDDKAYPYIKFSMADKVPRLYLARKVKKDGSMYFGPYTSGGNVWQTIKFLNRTFKIRDCTDAVYNTRKRPCMTYQIGRCTAPCVNIITPEDYKNEVQGALLFLKGKNKSVIKAMTEKMTQAANEEKFEVAARVRDSLQAIKAILQKQSVINDTTEKDQDAIGYYGDERGVLIETIHIRAGRVLGTRSHYIPGIDPQSHQEDVREWLVDFMNQYYEDNFIPDEVLLAVDIGFDMTKLLEDVLKARSDKKIVVRFATDTKGNELIEMANTNAKSHFEKHVSKSEEKMRGLDEVMTKLSLAKRPRRIECYDISTFQGSETVASQVVFEDGVPAKEHYRRYKIKTVEGINDFASMYEVLSRRFKHDEYDDPDLIVIDGGKGQLSQAIKILEELNKSHLPVVGLAKARTERDFQAEEVKATEERFYLPGRQNPVTFRSNSEAFYILVGIRDEAHRFAITYHRKLRENTSLESELDLVTGLGEKRKRILLEHFASVEVLKNADPEEIAKLKTFNRVLAERVLLQLNETGDESDEGNAT